MFLFQFIPVFDFKPCTVQFCIVHENGNQNYQMKALYFTSGLDACSEMLSMVPNVYPFLLRVQMW